MKKTIIKLSVFLTVFIMSVMVASSFFNKSRDNMTMEMAPASFPLITMVRGDIAYNRLFGYAGEMVSAFAGESITLLGQNRELEFTVDTYGMNISGISMEVRSLDGERLIESKDLEWTEAGGERLEVRTGVKDLIESGEEYMLILLLKNDGDDLIRYYTRIMAGQAEEGGEKLAFIQRFHSLLYDKEAAKELIPYLEPNSRGDNTTFSYVNIHSSFDQVTWGSLPVKEVMEPVIELTALQGQTASALLSFLVGVDTENGTSYYTAEEYYRIRYTADRVYLLDYERKMTQIPSLEGMVSGDKILLGIVDPDVEFTESGDGNIVVFQEAGRLCSYNANTNRLAVLFSFQDQKETDVRNLNMRHGIKVLDVSEGGNVRFAVYGYMNRGRHEGRVGLQVCQYDSEMNTVEELAYIPYSKGWQVLACEMDKLLYLNRDNSLYLYLESAAYRVSLTDKSVEELVRVEWDERLKVSETNQIVVWQEGASENTSTSLQIRNLATGETGGIEAGADEYIKALGFMGEDIIYGVCRRSDMWMSGGGSLVFPMYMIGIADSGGKVLKEYARDGIYVTECRVEDNQITLARVTGDSQTGYRETEEDHILNNVGIDEGKNKIAAVSIDTFKKYVQIQLRNGADGKNTKVLTPKEVVFEGGRELALTFTDSPEEYYAYSGKGLEGIYGRESLAVQTAYAFGGIARGEHGETLWQRTSLAARNQIMAIAEKTVPEGSSSLAVCLETMLEHKGIVRSLGDSLQDASGRMPGGNGGAGTGVIKEILEESIPGVSALELEGCSVEAMLYYVNMDIPVLAILDDGEAVLITGFNEYNVVILEPKTGTLYKKGIQDSGAWFTENGNHFFTYI